MTIERSTAVTAKRNAADVPANRLLALLSPKDYERLRRISIVSR